MKLFNLVLLEERRRIAARIISRVFISFRTKVIIPRASKQFHEYVQIHPPPPILIKLKSYRNEIL